MATPTPLTDTPTLDPGHELPAATGSSTLGADALGSGAASGTLGSTGGQQNAGVAQQAKEQAKNLAHDAKEQTKKVADQARDHVQGLVDQQKGQYADRLGSLAGALRETGRKLNEGEQTGDFGRYADRAAEQVERLSNYLRDQDLRSFVRDTETFARRRPDVFLGGTFVAGLLLARFLKASSPNEAYDGGNPGGTNYGGNWTGYPDSARRTTPPATDNYSSYTPERRNPDDAGALGTESYNAPLGV
jgi:uncharacterized protein YjbJ (UPF0337 family)